MAERANTLSRIEVRGLFGRADYDIHLDAAAPTVLTGANGTGKSTLLRLVNSVSSGNAISLANAPVDSFRLSFSSGLRFTLDRRAGGAFDLTWGDKTGVLDWPEHGSEAPAWALRLLLEHRDTNEPMDYYLRDYARNAGVSFDEYERARRLLLRSNRGRRRISAPEWLSEISDEFPVLYITDQRLIVSSDTDHPKTPGASSTVSRSLAVEKAAEKISELIQDADSAYTRISLLEDRRFPQEVIRVMNENPRFSPVELGKLIRAVEERRSALRAVGLLDSDDSYQPEVDPRLIEPHVAPVIDTFLRAALRKMEVVGDLAEKLTEFQRFLDGRFSRKRVVLSREAGLRFRLDGGREIGPGQLSSGEQQVTVLAYEILFNTSPSTLVLVDEPELSLHVLWQDTLIEDLYGMGRASRLQFLMATHAPAILANYPDLERSLDVER